MSESAPAAHQPLDGVRVVEIGTSVAAPYAAWILAGLGADVVKIERPEGGDDARQWGRLFADGSSPFFLALNRDKRGITLDLKQDTEREWLRDFCRREADVVIQNLRPGRVDAYGLGADDLRDGNPRLIYCNLWAFGRTGPMKEQPGYDPLMQACGGLMSVTGEGGRSPIRVGTSIIDMGTGLWCAVGILSALTRRSLTGEGCIIDASLYETALAWMTNHASQVQVDGCDPEPQGSGMRGIAPYQAYRCSDGYLVIAAPNDRLFTRLAEALGQPEWAEDPRFDDNQHRNENVESLNALMGPLLERESRQHWQQRLDSAGVPSAPVRTTLEMMSDPQTEALGMLQALDETAPGLMGIPLSFNGERPPIRRRAPSLGEHNAEIKQ